MGMVVIQPCSLVSKLKKIQTIFLRCSNCLNSFKKPVQQDVLQVRVILLSKLLTSCIVAVKNHVIKHCEKVYERSGRNLFWSFENSGEVLEYQSVCI